jgi:hypothetical protein
MAGPRDAEKLAGSQLGIALHDPQAGDVGRYSASARNDAPKSPLLLGITAAFFETARW